MSRLLSIHVYVHEYSIRDKHPLAHSLRQSLLQYLAYYRSVSIDEPDRRPHYRPRPPRILQQPEIAVNVIRVSFSLSLWCWDCMGWDGKELERERKEPEKSAGDNVTIWRGSGSGRLSSSSSVCPSVRPSVHLSIYPPRNGIVSRATAPTVKLKS